MLFTFIVNKLGGYNGLRQRYHATSSSWKRYCYQKLNRGLEHETGSYLPMEAKIAGPINFLHGTYGIFISNNAQIGKNCTLYHQVTIGSNMLLDSGGLGSPVIGDHCLIGAGAKIIGNVKIGDHCRIGANAVVTQDLPDHSVAVMGKTTIIQKQNLHNATYQQQNGQWGYQENGQFIKETDPQKIQFLEDKF